MRALLPAVATALLLHTVPARCEERPAGPTPPLWHIRLGTNCVADHGDVVLEIASTGTVKAWKTIHEAQSGQERTRLAATATGTIDGVAQFRQYRATSELAEAELKGIYGSASALLRGFTYAPERARDGGGQHFSLRLGTSQTDRWLSHGPYSIAGTAVRLRSRPALSTSSSDPPYWPPRRSAMEVSVAGAPDVAREYPEVLKILDIVQLDKLDFREVEDPRQGVESVELELLPTSMSADIQVREEP